MRRPATLLLVLSACTEVHVVDRATIDAERFAFVDTDEAGNPVAISPIHEGAEQQTFALERTVYVIGLSDDGLRALDARYRPGPLRLELAPPPDPPQLVFEGAAALSAGRIPPDAPLIEARAGTPAPATVRNRIEASLRLTMPIDVEACAAERPVHLRPFGATELLLEDVPEVLRAPSHRDVIAVSGAGEHALLLTEAALYVVRRGEAPVLPDVVTPGDPFVESPVLWAITLGANVRFHALAPVLAPVGGANHFYVAGEDGGLPAIWRLALGDSGVHVLHRSGVPGDATGPVLDILVDGQGIAVAAGEGFMFIAEHEGNNFLPATAPPDAGRIHRAAPSHQLTQPHVIATDTSLFVGLARSGTWAATPTGERVLAIAGYVDGNDVWAAGERGFLLRRRGAEAWSAPELVYPPSLSACGTRSPETGRVHIDDALSGVMIDSGFVYLQPRACSGMLRVRRGDLCVSRVAGDAFGLADHPRTAAGSWEDVHVVGGARGLLLEVALSP